MWALLNKLNYPDEGPTELKKKKKPKAMNQSKLIKKIPFNEKVV